MLMNKKPDDESAEVAGITPEEPPAKFWFLAV